MKRSIFSAITLIVCVFASCNDDMGDVVPQNNTETKTVSHAIPVEDAIADLENFLAGLDNNGTVTKSGSASRQISSINVIRKRDAVTRSSVSDNLNADSLLYVVNFENNQGYALLSADDRVSSGIIFVGDSGNVDLGDWQPINPNYEPRTIYPEFPTNGPGTFYENNDSTGELFMNPNTFDLYDATYDDYYVGDFYYNGKSEYEEMISQINDLALNFVNFEIETSESIYQEIPYQDEPIGNNYHSVTTIETDTVIIVNKLLNHFKNWSQRQYFNKYCPERTNKNTGEKELASAGCVSLAIAKIMTYHKFPYILNTDICRINWNSIWNNPGNRDGMYSGALTKNIRDYGVTLYFSQGTFTLPSTMASYLRNHGYSNVDYRGYNTEIVKNMLDNNCPIFICSVPSGSIIYQLEHSHAWNIDGYLNRIKTYTVDNYCNDDLLSTDTYTESEFMVHCDFGWSGACNGYFASGVFDLTSEDVIFDNEIYRGYKDYYYKWYIKIIQYDYPN